MNILVQLINLDRSAQRLETMQRQFQERDIAFERLDATDGRNLTRHDRSFYSPLRCLLYFGRGLADNEIGCYRSHMRALERLLASDADVSLVLEDDAVIPEDFDALMQSVTALLAQPANSDWEVVNLGNAPESDLHYLEVGKVAGGRSLVQVGVFPQRNTAMLWSRRGAERFLTDAKTIRAPIDHEMISMLCKTGFSVLPAPIPHSNAESEIDADVSARLIRTYKNQSAWYYWRHKRRKNAARKRGKAFADKH